MDIIHHYLEIMVSKEGSVHGLMELYLCAFKNKRNHSEVLIKARSLILSEVSGVIIPKIGSHTKEGCVLGKAGENESDDILYFKREIIFGDSETHAGLKQMGGVLGIVLVHRGWVNGRCSSQNFRDHLVLRSKIDQDFSPLKSRETGVEVSHIQLIDESSTIRMSAMRHLHIVVHFGL